MAKRGPEIGDALKYAAKTIAVATIVVLVVVVARRGHASCDVIPGLLRSFPSALGTIDRPFAGPDDWVKLTRDTVCRPSSATFGSDDVVSLIFKPTGGGPRTVVAIADSCPSLQSQLESCEARADVARALCIPAVRGGSDINVNVASPSRLDVRFPAVRLCSGDPSTSGACVVDADCPSGECVSDAGDAVTLSGPVVIAVTPSTADLPCALASEGCSNQTDFTACIDALFSPEREQCNDTPHEVFPSFTALPVPNDYAKTCVAPVPPCQAAADPLRFTTDDGGNLLLPMDWHGVLVDRDFPVPRLLRGESSIAAFPGTGQALIVPDNSFLGSFALNGGRLAPIFDPQTTRADDESPSRLFGTADASRTVLRIGRRGGGALTCAGGPSAGQRCTGGGDCPNGTCGAAICVGGMATGRACSAPTDCPEGSCREGLFDFGSRALAGIGPVLVGDFENEALDPVPLDGLAQSTSANVFVPSEAVEARILPAARRLDADLNGDGDTTDSVLTLGDRRTGELQPLLRPTQCPSIQPAPVGRAIVRVRTPPFSFPASAVEGDVVAFLESEPGQGDCDENQDGDVFDAILRVFRLGGSEVVPQIPDGAIDAAPRVAHRSVAVSNGLVFVRSQERSRASRTTGRVSVGPTGIQSDNASVDPGISADGRFVVFVSNASNLALPATSGQFDVFRRDVATGIVVRASVAGNGELGNDDSLDGAISADGGSVTFASHASNLVPNDLNQALDIFVRDLQAGTTTLVSRGIDGAPADGPSFRPSISSDGRIVAFASDATNLVPGDTNGVRDVFIFDRQTGMMERVDLASPPEAPMVSTVGALSGNGRVVAVRAASLDPATGEENGTSQIFVWDRDAGTPELASVDARGIPGNSNSDTPSMSADGRFVVFTSRASNLLGDTNGSRDVFVRDRERGTVDLVSASSSGIIGNRDSLGGAISPDGRFVAFVSDATNLVAGDDNQRRDTFVRDRLTGLVERVSIPSAAEESNGSSTAVSISAEAAAVVFDADATNLTAPDTNATFDVFVRSHDRADLAHDLTGDGDLDDTVLEVLDGATGARVGPACPAGDVGVSHGVAAFLRPESAGQSAGCPGGRSSFNGDGDTSDDVTYLWSNGKVTNLGKAASAIAVSESHVAALVSEAGQSDGDLDGDGDVDDHVVHVRPVRGGGWTNLGRAADQVAMAQAVVAFLTPRQVASCTGAAAGHALTLYLADAKLLIDVGATARDFVIGGYPGNELVAFRTNECDENQDLNGDGDESDDVLQIYDVAARRATGESGLVSTGMAVTPCRLEACDPQQPYKVGRDTVTFLTLERDQGGIDLNDNQKTDLVLQIYNARRASDTVTQLRLARSASDSRAASVVAADEPSRVLAATSRGLCTNTGEACSLDDDPEDADDCPGGSCFVPPGGCLRDLGSICDPSAPICFGGSNTFCEPQPGGTGKCRENDGPCTSDRDCTNPSASCNNANQQVQRVLGPLASPGGAGVVVTSAGKCVEELAVACSTDADCSSTAFCGRNGLCRRERDSCRADADCPPNSTCQQRLATVTMADTDGDEIPDALDDCPLVPDVLQLDTDLDGIGDACDCGNGRIDQEEACDDGNAADGDGCDARCRVERCATCGGEPSTCEIAKPCRACQKILIRSVTLFSRARAKALAACELKRLAGKVPFDQDCRLEGVGSATIAEGARRLADKVAAACGGKDKVCGGNLLNEPAPIELGFPLACPNFGNGGCGMAIHTCDDIAACLECVGAGGTDLVDRLAAGALSPSDPKAEKPLNQCQQTIVRHVTKLQAVTTAALDRCWTARLSGKHGAACPAPGDGRSAATIEKAKRQLRAAICKKCGGPDKACGGGDDLSPIMIGFASSCLSSVLPGTASCTEPVSSMLDVVECVDCGVGFATSCVDASRVPEFVAYPGSCNP